MPPYEVITADAVAWAQAYDGPPFHALLCDPPYHLTSITKRFGKQGAAPAQFGKDGAFSRASAGFMGQTWDGGDVAFRPETWAAFLRIMHPGAFGMAFASSRGWHRLACAIEDAGFIIHPSIFVWLYGQGFPKATRIDTQIDRAAGAERTEVAGVGWHHSTGRGVGMQGNAAESWPAAYEKGDAAKGEPVMVPATDLAKTWQHHRYGLQALKPAAEPIIVFQRPYEGRPVDDITRTGAGAINIDGSRIEGNSGAPREGEASQDRRYGKVGATNMDALPGPRGGDPKGRWPANFALVHAPECRRIGTGKVKTGTAIGGLHNASGTNTIYAQMERRDGQPDDGYADADGLESVDVWECVDGCPVRALDEQAGYRADPGSPGRQALYESNPSVADFGGLIHGQGPIYNDAGGEGSASRFFFNAIWEQIEQADPVRYEEKASTAERERGLEWMETKSGRANRHPTVKPVSLARWLATLLLPPAPYSPRRLLVPFSGVASEMIGAKQAGWEEVVGLEAKADYAEIAVARLQAWIGML